MSGSFLLDMKYADHQTGSGFCVPRLIWLWFTGVRYKKTAEAIPKIRERKHCAPWQNAKIYCQSRPYHLSQTPQCALHFPQSLSACPHWIITSSPSSPVKAAGPVSMSATAILSSASIRVSGYPDGRPIPGSGPTTMGCNCTIQHSEPQHPPNE